MTRLSFKAALVLTAFCAGCDDSPTAPSRGAIATFAVDNETFRVRLIGDEQVAAARAASWWRSKHSDWSNRVGHAGE